MTSTRSSFISMQSESGQSALSTKFSASTMSKMAFVTPTKSKRSFTATSPPPVPTKKHIRLPTGTMDDDEASGFSFPRFPLLVDEDDMCYDAPDTPSSILSESTEDDDMMYCTPTQTFNSPLSVEKFAIPRIRLKPRVSGNIHDENTSDSSNRQDLPTLLLFPQVSEEASFDSHIRLSFRPTGLNLTLSQTLYDAHDA